MADWLTDVESWLERVEEMLEGLSGDGWLSFYARDLTRLVAWLRTQPRSRVLVLGALGVGLVVGAVLLSTHREPAAAGQRPCADLPAAEPEGWQGPP